MGWNRKWCADLAGGKNRRQEKRYFVGCLGAHYLFFDSFALGKEVSSTECCLLMRFRIKCWLVNDFFFLPIQYKVYNMLFFHLKVGLNPNWTQPTRMAGYEKKNNNAL